MRILCKFHTYNFVYFFYYFCATLLSISIMKTKLFETRNKKGFSQEQLADLVGMTQANYSRKENGLSKITQQEWELLAKKLNVPIESIFEEEPKNIIYKNIKGNSFNSGTININIPDFVMNYMELLKTENSQLKSENQNLKEQLKSFSKD